MKVKEKILVYPAIIKSIFSISNFGVDVELHLFYCHQIFLTRRKLDAYGPMAL